MAVIELGELRDEPLVDDLGPRSRRLPRWPLLIALLALLLGTMTAAGVGPRPVFEMTVAAQPNTYPIVDGDRLYLIDDTSTPVVRNPQITAYQLPGGERLWQAPIPIKVRRPNLGGPGSYVDTRVVGDLILFSGQSAPEAMGQTVAWDAATGVERWRRDGNLEEVTSAGDVLLWDGRYGDTYDPIDAGTLWSVDAATGRPRWSYQLPEKIRPFFRVRESGVDLAALRLAKGTVLLLDLTTGKVGRSREISPPEVPTAGNPSYMFGIVDDLLFVSGPDLTTVTAYELDGLTPRWTVHRDALEYGPMDCGAGDPCFYLAQGGVRVLDQETGATRWSNDQWDALMSVGGYVLAFNTPRASGARLNVLNVLDAATGRILGNLGTWETMGLPMDGEPLLAVHHDPSKRRAWIAELDPARLGVQVLEVLDNVSGDCMVSTNVVTCRRMDGSLGVWARPE